MATFLSTLSEYVRAFDSPEKREAEDVEFISHTWGYPESDIKARRAPMQRGA